MDVLKEVVVIIQRDITNQTYLKIYMKKSRVGCILTNDEFDELDRIVSNGLKK